MDAIQPYLIYIETGVGIAVGSVILAWVFFSLRFFLGTRKLTAVLTNFFELVVAGEIDRAYEMTSPKFKTRTPKAKFKKFLKSNKLDKYKRITMPVPDRNRDTKTLDVSVVLSSGREVPLKADIIKKGNGWEIDILEKNKNKS
ncbi:hypothetical protein IQ235_00265 [Oscillatoriales cyanobacterium LEGE 11467]|uniref:DUF4878 domain-containing protein n=1 Tax=Zarconia navalis LEGE 11467 TaxID=1828826 RepID=A0A928VRV6_9CYAN|nr:hypothetical protein [Zarconia navalis]MBE9039229.1 hypothetical protein [Zarconia navalis LEGE 11467]